MSNIYVFRHGKTSFNEDQKYIGLMDVSLNSNGVKEAKALREKLRGKTIDLAYTSPLLRAKQTLNVVLQSHDESRVISYHLLQERDFGIVTGFYKERLEELFPDINSNSIKNQWDYNTHQGESFTDLEKKLFPFLDLITYQSSVEKMNIAISTHIDPLRIIRKYFEGLSNEEAMAINNKNCELISYKR